MRCRHGIIASQQLQSLGIENYTTPTVSTQPLRSKDMAPYGRVRKRTKRIAGRLHKLPKLIKPADDGAQNRVRGSYKETNDKIDREAM